MSALPQHKEKSPLPNASFPDRTLVYFARMVEIRSSGFEGQHHDINTISQL